MKKVLSILLLCIGTMTLVSAQYDPKALAILDAMSKKYKDMNGFKAKFTYSLESPGSGINESSEGEIIVKGQKYRLKLSQQEIINNGQTVWTYMKESNEVNISAPEDLEDDLSPTQIYTMYKKGFKYTLVQESKPDANTDVVELVPEDMKKQIAKVRLEINKKDKTLKSWKVIEKNGNKYVYTVKSFAPNYKVEDSFFTLDTKGMEINDLR